MVEKKLYSRFYAALTKYAQADKWEKFLRVSDRFYKVLFNSQQQTTNPQEKKYLLEEMSCVDSLERIVTEKLEKQEEERENSPNEITRIKEKMHEAFQRREFDLALTFNDMAYKRVYANYQTAQGKEKIAHAQQLASLFEYQDFVISHQLKDQR